MRAEETKDFKKESRSDDESREKMRDGLYKIIYDATIEKFSILPVLSGLMLALLALAISSGLLETTTTTKHIATILLLLMILSIQIHYSENISLLTKAHKKFREYGGNSPKEAEIELSFGQSIKYLLTGKVDKKIVEIDFYKRFSSQFPGLAILILWFVVLLLVVEIWF